jgi:RNA polymerase sigma factor (sigma-70 family)
MWDVVEAAGARDPGALDDLAREYRAPVLAFIRRRGVAPDVAEDLCHDVFVRVLRGGVLAKADRDRGTFRSLLCTVTIRVIQDWRRRHPELPSTNDEPVAPAPDFDRAWAVHLTERALGALKEVSPRAYEVVLGHLAGVKQDRNKLWIARRKLVALIRREVALTCQCREDFEREVAVLSPYLRPSSRAALFSVQKS